MLFRILTGFFKLCLEHRASHTPADFAVIVRIIFNIPSLSAKLQVVRPGGAIWTRRCVCRIFHTAKLGLTYFVRYISHGRYGSVDRRGGGTSGRWRCWCRRLLACVWKTVLEGYTFIQQTFSKCHCMPGIQVSELKHSFLVCQWEE